VPKCKVCKEKFTPTFNSLQPTCGEIKCAVEWGRKLRGKETRKALAKHHENDKSWVRTKAQEAFNKYIRLRDKGQGCISCGTTKDVQYAAGHYRSRGGAPQNLAFHEWNVNLQCNRKCNMALSGNIGEYRIRLIQKIGLENVEWLENQNTPVKLTIEELREIRDTYKAKYKELK